MAGPGDDDGSDNAMPVPAARSPVDPAAGVIFAGAATVSAASEADRGFMAEAIRLSRTHTGQTSTNPSVGCVVVRDGVIVGRGVTAVGGRPHAEPQALADAGRQSRGATAYVTLEPCSHYGHTPPCANALVEAGVARVVISLTDPDPRVSGRGVAILEAAGIMVETGVMAAESREALVGYLTRQTKHRPHVTLKLAVSADGMIGKAGAGQVAITGPLARAAVQQLRAQTDAILIGIGTALADDPELTCRIPGLEQLSPIRIVLDRNLDLPPNSKLATTANTVPVIVVSDGSPSPQRGEGDRRADEGEPQAPDSPHSARSDSRKDPLIASLGSARLPEGEKRESVAATISDASICTCGTPSVGPADISPTRGESNPELTPASPFPLRGAKPASPSPQRGEGVRRADEGVSQTADPRQARQAALESCGVEILRQNPADLATLLTTLATRGISTLLVEGGAKVAKAFLDAHLVDRILLFTGPDAVGADGILAPIGRDSMPKDFHHLRQTRFGPDLCDTYESDA
jgi:diaminohydroxyphosphoribosylaminopyrimidine deaminase/5-amino-6-(5-phosphoribosylamino)uracil reductase